MEPNTSEPFETPEKIWKDLDPDSRKRALRLLSELCYAYVVNQSKSEFSEGEAKDSSANHDLPD